MNKRLIILCFFAVAAVMSWWLLRSTEPAISRMDDKLQHDPDYYLDKFLVTSMDVSGVPAYRLYADKMQHYPDDGTAILDNPHLMIYRSVAETWDIRSMKGLVEDEGKTVHLQGEVLIKRLTDSPDRALKITTSDLSVQPEEEYAETSQAVIISSKYGETKAVGMQTYIDERRLRLLSHVRGVYEPK